MSRWSSDITFLIKNYLLKSLILKGIILRGDTKHQRHDHSTRGHKCPHRPPEGVQGRRDRSVVRPGCPTDTSSGLQVPDELKRH